MNETQLGLFQQQVNREQVVLLAEAISAKSRADVPPDDYTDLQIRIRERLLSTALPNYKQIAEEEGCSSGYVSRIYQDLVDAGIREPREYYERRDGLVVRMKGVEGTELATIERPSFEFASPVAQVFDNEKNAIVPVSVGSESHPVAQMLADSVRGMSDSVSQATARFIRYTESNDYDFLRPRLREWRDSLLAEGDKEPGSINNLVGTIRRRYQLLLKSNDFRDYVYSLTPGDQDILNKKAYVDEVMLRIQNEMEPGHSNVKVDKKSDAYVGEGSKKIWFTREQAIELMSAPAGNAPTRLAVIRDTAMLATFLCTGVRRNELRLMDVSHMRVMFDDHVALNVPKGKGGKQRNVVWGELAWCLKVIDGWLSAAEITEGAVWRGLWKEREDGSQKVRDERLSLSALNKIINPYEVNIDGVMRRSIVHDLRRTYARTQYMLGMDLLAVQANMGHAQIDTTKGYIGELGGEARAGKAAYDFKEAVEGAVFRIPDFPLE